MTKVMINLCEVIVKTNPGFTVKKMHNGVPILLTDWPSPPSSFVSKKSDTDSLMEKLKNPKEGQTTLDPSIPIGKVQLNDQKQLGNNIFSHNQDDGHQTYYINYNPYNSWKPDGRKKGIEIPHIRSADFIQMDYGDRNSLLSLLPTAWVDQEVLNHLCARLTSIERTLIDTATTWFLPTTFVQYSLDMETPTETIISYYQEDFMGPVEMLGKIYVPINDAHVHWYLLVVDFDAHVHWILYHAHKKGM
ncbi:Papain-like cysteine peptidase superfamily [Sesbania bispinosa]|nr:Papain-like cysteine peptidase superfamily [Sesbania bispinosa]